MKRKIQRKEDAVAVSEALRQAQLETLIANSEFWPLSAPGMPAIGPDFLMAAYALGDATIKTDKHGIPSEYAESAILDDLHKRALRQAGFTMAVQSGNDRVPVQFIPGHIWGQYAQEWQASLLSNGAKKHVDGPQKAKVMVVGKMPWVEEHAEMRNLVGTSGQILSDTVEKLKIKGARYWYVTNLVKFMPPDNSTRLRANWIKDCLPLLHEELRIVRPDYILCLGSDATKAILGKDYGVRNMEGRCVEKIIPLAFNDRDDTNPQHIAKVMTVIHPAEVSRDNTQLRVFERGMARFGQLITGVSFLEHESDIDHRVIDNYDDAVLWAAEVKKDLDKKRRTSSRVLMAWDCEWQGRHPLNHDSYLRTIQISWDLKKAVCFKIAHAGGALAFRDKEGKPAIKRLAKLLNEVSEGTTMVGHFINADLEWLHYYGIYPEQDIPVDPEGNKEAWELLREGRGCYDTALATHAIEETAQLGLEILTARYTNAPRYDLKLEEYKKKRKVEAAMSDGEELNGYGDIPDNILHFYALYDADVTYRLMVELLQYLDNDYFDKNCWVPFWESMLTQPVILDIHKNGMFVDRARIDKLTVNFMQARHVVFERVKEEAAWPEMNLRSTDQVKEYLFGFKLNNRREKNGDHKRLSPLEANLLNLKPITDTGKPPRLWDKIVAEGLEFKSNPSTSKASLAILAEDNLDKADQIKGVLDARLLDQTLKSILRPPVEILKQEPVDDTKKKGKKASKSKIVNPYKAQFFINDDGFMEYEAGLANSVDDDGRVRTNLRPTAETARWKSSRPNLQNISKSRDDDYTRLLGEENYKTKLRSVLIAGGHLPKPALPARPQKLAWINNVPGEVKKREDHACTKQKLLFDFDYTGAELFAMAIMAQDENMIDHARRGALPDEGYDEKGNRVKGGKFPHPDYYDIHSNIAVLAFNLTCPPTKKGLADAGKKKFRILAKNVIFGVAYGRGAKAIALQARENKNPISPETAQKVIDTIFDTYPRLESFFEKAKERASRYQWLCNSFGRYRRFPKADDPKIRADFERQAMNYPIQSMIAGCVDRGLAKLRQIIRQQGLQDYIKIVLQIHDAAVLEVDPEYADHAMDLVNYAMQACVPIYPTDLEGKPLGTGPFHLGLDRSLEINWGEEISEEKCHEWGIKEPHLWNQ